MTLHADTAASRAVAHSPEGDEDDREDFGAVPFEQRTVAASACQPPVTLAPNSIFAMAAAMLKTGGRFGRADGFRKSQAPAQRPTVDRKDGVTRCVGAQYPSNRMDSAKIESERARRAKQRPPKPTKKAKTRGRKLLELIGEPDDEA